MRREWDPRECQSELNGARARKGKEGLTRPRPDSVRSKRVRFTKLAASGGHVRVVIACQACERSVDAGESARAHAPLRWYSGGLSVKRAGALLTRFVHHGGGRVTRQSLKKRHSFVYSSDKPLSASLTLVRIQKRIFGAAPARQGSEVGGCATMC